MVSLEAVPTEDSDGLSSVHKVCLERVLLEETPCSILIITTVEMVFWFEAVGSQVFMVSWQQVSVWAVMGGPREKKGGRITAIF